jgi:hypothetical protein
VEGGSDAAAKNLASSETNSDNRAGNGDSHPTTMPGQRNNRNMANP